MLALRLSCTVEELGARLSAREFAEWQIIFQREQLHPSFERLRHAQLLAAVLTGASKRKGGKAWSPSDFMPVDSWAPTVPAALLVKKPKLSDAERMMALHKGGRNG